MIPKPEIFDRPAVAYVTESIIRSYAVVYFSQRLWMGALFLAATLIDLSQLDLAEFNFSQIGLSQVGLCGLLGVIVSLAAATLLRFQPAAIRSGSYLFNPLLVSLFIGHMGQSRGDLGWTAIVPLVIACALLALFLTVFLSRILHDHFGLPSLAMPSLLVILLVFRLLAVDMPSVEFTGTEVAGLVGFTQLGKSYLECLGAIFFRPEWLVGLILFTCWLVESRMIVFYSMVGYVMGVTSVVLLGDIYGSIPLVELGLNWVLCGIALGCVFFIPSLSSIAVVALGVVFSTLIAFTFRTSFGHTLLPPIALGFNLVVPMIIYAMRTRTQASYVHGTPFFVGTPEDNFRQFWLYRARFPGWQDPSVQVPFVGQRVVTQGFGGEMTHQGDYEFGLDFEVLDDTGHAYAGDGSTLDNFYTYNTPVLAPGYGTVVTVVDSIPDRKIGSQNLSQNWGNLVILLLDSGHYTALCHLRRGSILVEEGDRVTAGEKIAVCGNSGRSPVPHLHLQLQNSPAIGAASIPFQLRHYLDREDGRSSYVYQGIPSEGDRIEPAVFDDAVAVFFDDVPSKEYSFQLTSGSRSWQESIRCEVNELGQYVLSSSRHRASLTAVVQDHVFYMQQYQGSCRSVLCWLWLGLSRVPFISDRRVDWNDFATAYPLLHLPGRLMMDLRAPLGRDPVLQLNGDVKLAHRAGGRQLLVNTRLESPVGGWMFRQSPPQEIQLVLDDGEFVLSGEVQLEQGTISFQRIGSHTLFSDE